jgi:purine-nucleoside phosphorylase
MTPHFDAARRDYADMVLLPGDPDRSAYIARTLLDDARCVNRIRGSLGFTGTYRGVPVSVQTTGMGQGSFAIYANELITFYGAKVLLRVGSCGSLSRDVHLRETVISERSVADNLTAGASFGATELAVRPDADLLRRARAHAEDIGQAIHVGLTGSSDYYYHPLGKARLAGLMADRAIAIDMETYALYTIAERLGARALSICTVVDSIVTDEEIARSERQAVFRPIAMLALEIVAGLKR